MSRLDIAKIDLVIANRVLAHLGAVDAYGHVSLRHPDDPTAFLIARSRSPELVDLEDLMVVGLDGQVREGDRRAPYMERFIYAALFAQRPDLHAAAHGHARCVIPFSVLPDLKMRPIFMTSDEIGRNIPVWDIRTRFGSGTDMLITTLEQGRDLAAAFGSKGKLVLMRGHGFTAGARSASQLLRLCKAMMENASIQLDCARFGTPIELTDDEITARQNTMSEDESPGLIRGFECDAVAAGVQHLFERRQALMAKLP